MKKQNILLVAGVFPPGVGGMQNYYYNLCKHSKHNVTVFASDYKNAAEFDAAQPFRTIRKPFLSDEKVSVVHTLRMIPQVARTIRQEAIDVTIYGYILYGLIGLFLQVIRGKKYGVSVHGMDVLKLTRFFLLRWLVKLILFRASVVMTNSEYVKGLMMELGVRQERIEVVYPGVEEIYDKTEKDPKLVHRHNLAGRYVLMTLGRLVERKGFDMVIRAMPAIREKIPEAVYLIVGGGPERDRLERLIKEYGVEDCVVLAGRAADQELPQYYNLCDVFVMPSRYIASEGDVEGFGIVYMEASSCCKPVIGGNSGGVVEAVIDGETGLIVDPTSPESISRAVIGLYEDKLLAKRLADKGYHRAKSQFHYKAITEGFDRCLSELRDGEKSAAVPGKTKVS
ncbi:MAG: glycosyltransferase family 1 protein [Paenibacillaceae bacterium]|jgi:phosphatidylinositol alpha-1,6-mannosyltransferase|nr:glycosyltransferase family 1 protein [Paenibacillaceae bacterium]